MRFLVTLLTIMILSSAVFAAVPNTITYQGRLTNSSGEPIDTTVSMVFSICDDSAAQVCIWGEVITDVEVVNGLFTVNLGSMTPLTHVFDDENRWLHVTVGSPGEAIEPPIKLRSVPYAFRVATIDGADGGFVSGYLEVEDLNVTDQLRIQNSFTPSGSGDASGVVGDVAWDDDFIYIKTNAGWKRTPLSSF
ncbi:MAG: hypothetical protein ABIJ12_06285 [bacterium]